MIASVYSDGIGAIAGQAGNCLLGILQAPVALTYALIKTMVPAGPIFHFGGSPSLTPDSFALLLAFDAQRGIRQDLQAGRIDLLAAHLTAAVGALIDPAQSIIDKP